MQMIKCNFNLSSPLQFIFNDGIIIGQFFNSKDNLYHLAEYIPYKLPPQKYLCNKSGNFSPSRDEEKINKCIQCWSFLKIKEKNEKN